MSWRVKVVNMKQRDDYIKEREFTYTNKCYILNMGLPHVNLTNILKRGYHLDAITLTTLFLWED